MTPRNPNPLNPLDPGSAVFVVARSPALVAIGFVLLKRWPDTSDWLVPTTNWLFGLVTLGFVLLASTRRLHRLFRWLVASAVVSYLLEAGLFGYDTYCRPVLTIEWPRKVPSNEAVVGGLARNLDRSDTVLKLYVCVKTSDTAACYLDMHSESPSIDGGSWQGTVRLGNERAENDHGQPEFFVVAVAFTSGQSPPAQDLPATAPALLRQIENIDPRVEAWAGPLQIAKTASQTPQIQISEVKHTAVGTHPPDIPIPALREPNYPVCPPVLISWRRTDGSSPLAAVEAWQDGRTYGAADAAVDYPILVWPADVERIEVKVSSTRGKGPYDSVYLKHGVCPQ